MSGERERIVYMCQVCLRASAVPEECHGQPMLECHCGEPGDPCTRPVTTTDGHVVTHAPRWWVEQTKRSQSI